MAAASSDAPILPMNELSTYHSRWTIKAKVTNKAPLGIFKKGASGEGKVFSADLLDCDGGEIKASSFNDAADKFNEMLQLGKVFTFSRGSVKVANKQYNHTNHRYELTFERDALIVPSYELTLRAVTSGTTIPTSEIENIAVKHTFVDHRVVQAKQLPCRVDGFLWRRHRV